MSPDYLDAIKDYNRRPASPRPGKCALLIIDMQRYFESIASPIIGNVLSIIDVCRASGIRVIFTRHGHKDLSEDGGMLAQWWGDSIMCGSKEWEFIKSLSPLETDAVLDKNRYSVFHGTDLDERLRKSGIEELIIIGVMTNCCCETTARDGFVRDYRIFFISDATATTSEELHLASLKNLAFGFAHIMSSEQLYKTITGYL
jgi:isochorismate hydrolase